jgi:lipopolysaccharide transport system ATP-binding protein
MEPEILLVDEVLAVGDAAFQRKCLGKMGDVARGGRTVLFVSHNMGAMNQLCSKSMWINEGRILQIGDTSSIVSSYIRQSYAAGGLPEVKFPELLSKDAQVRQVRLLDSQRKVAQSFLCDEPIIIELLLDVRQNLTGLFGYMECARLDGTVVLMSESFDTIPDPMNSLPVGCHTLCITIPARTLAAGDYTLYLNFRMLGREANVDRLGIVCSFRLDDTMSRRGNNRPGFLSTLLKWELENSPSVSN